MNSKIGLLRVYVFDVMNVKHINDEKAFPEWN